MAELPFKIDLSGKTAVVTGGGGVLCGEMSRALAACGARVAVFSRQQKNADHVANSITEAGGSALAVTCDVSSRDALDKANRIVEAEFGPCDILICGAGGNDPGAVTSRTRAGTAADPKTGDDTDFFDLAPDAIETVIGVNFLGTVYASQVFGKAMAARGSGSIVLISSIAATRPLSRVPAYDTAKAAVKGFTQWLAVHLAPTGVRVNAIAPGFFVTRQNERLLTNEDGSLTERGEAIMAHTPMKRFGRPEELIGALLFLVDDKAASFVTGSELLVDGGLLADSGI